MIILDKIHPTEVDGISADKELGATLGMLRYDVLNEVLIGLCQELLRQQDKDALRGRGKLALSLGNTVNALNGAIKELDAVIQICKPYIEEEKKK